MNSFHVLAIILIFCTAGFAISYKDNERFMRAFSVFMTGCIAATLACIATMNMGYIGDARRASYNKRYVFMGEVPLTSVANPDERLVVLKDVQSGDNWQFRFYTVALLKTGDNCVILNSPTGQPYLQKAD